MYLTQKNEYESIKKSLESPWIIFVEENEGLYYSSIVDLSNIPSSDEIWYWTSDNQPVTIPNSFLCF